MHGNPSGLDNTICTFGNVVKFYKGHPPVDIKLACSLPILLVDSGVGRSTAKLVEKVTELRARHTKLVDNIFEAMKYLVEDAVDILEHITHISDTENFHKLEVCLAGFQVNFQTFLSSFSCFSFATESRVHE